MHGKVLYFSYHYKIRCNEIFYSPALGDPLIKGLTEVANARPKDPVTYLATYLYNFASKNKAEQVYVWLKQWTNWILQDIIALTKSSALFFFHSDFRNLMSSLYLSVKKKIWKISRMNISMKTPVILEVQLQTYLNPRSAILIEYVNENIHFNTFKKQYFFGKKLRFIFCWSLAINTTISHRK